jgi:uncharacterized small protein (TIGR04563 family)
VALFSTPGALIFDQFADVAVRSPLCVTYSIVMSGSDKRKQSLYFPEEMLKEIGDEATRQDRSLSWIVQKAWKAARKEIMSIPSVNDIPSDTPKDEPKKVPLA